MPTEFEKFGYKVYFWSNENKEPIHVHISKNPSSKATKVWLTSSGGVVLEHNKSRVPKEKLNIILNMISLYHSDICKDWLNFMGYITFKI
jgi:hypothetical protein